MGRHQRAETSGLISFLICAVVGAVSMNLYMEYAPAIWQLTQRRFMVCSGIVAACGVISFIIGYARKSRSLNLKHGWFAPIRRIFEIVALSVVYASTIFLSSFALIGAANDMMGNAIFSGYISSVCAAFAGVVGYMTFVRFQPAAHDRSPNIEPFFRLDIRHEKFDVHNSTRLNPCFTDRPRYRHPPVPSGVESCPSLPEPKNRTFPRSSRRGNFSNPVGSQPSFERNCAKDTNAIRKLTKYWYTL